MSREPVAVLQRRGGRWPELDAVRAWAKPAGRIQAVGGDAMRFRPGDEVFAEAVWEVSGVGLF